MSITRGQTAGWSPADPLPLNGIDAVSGHYLGQLTVRDIAEAARAEAVTAPPELDRELGARGRQIGQPTLAPRFGVDALDLAQAGWGVIFAADADPAVQHALAPLLRHRKQQAAALAERRYQVFAGDRGFRRGDSKREFLTRHGAGPGPVNPDVMPYYLLLVGGPEDIPFDVQLQLGVQHAVGRLHLYETAAYARYAESVVAVERAAERTAGPTRLAFFAPRHDGDKATACSVEHLVAPLADELAGHPDSWQVTVAIGADATKERLVAQLTGPDRPDILLAAAHGVGFPSGHGQQRPAQGALVCQDWVGSGSGPVQPTHWFGPADVMALGPADLTGMVAFLFACYGAGTPALDNYHRGPGSARSLAPSPFVAALPQAMLGREGAALAVLGHVDRAWNYSFVWPGLGRQTEVFRGSLARLGAGHPVGSALEYLGLRAAELAADLEAAREDIRIGKRVDDDRLAELWIAARDSRNYVILGDPAVRAVADPQAHQLRPTGLVSTIPTPAIAGSRIEIDTYLTDDPAAVGFDPQTGRITGATRYLSSRMGPDEPGRHVLTSSHGMLAVGGAVPDEHDRRTAVNLHTRLIEIQLAGGSGEAR